MIKRSLLAAAIAAVSAQSAVAAPFLPMDARGLAMGNTGVASAQRAHAPAYNPSLLSQAHEDDDFALLFPQVGVNVADEEEMISEAESISDDIFPEFEDVVGDASTGLEFNIDALNNSITNFQNTIDNLDGSANDISNLTNANNDLKAKLTAVGNDLGALNSSTNDLTKSLRNISGSPLTAKLGVGGSLAIPGKSFAAAVSVQGSANVAALANFSDKDLELLGAYVPAAQEYVTAADDLTDAVDTALANSNDPAELANQLNNLDADALLNVANGYTSNTTIDGNPVISNGELSNAASNPDLSSNVQIVAVSVIDAGISLSREFDIVGEKIAIGITPKIQKVSTYHYADEIDGFDEVEADDIEDTREDYSQINLDIGASYRFGSEGNWVAGVVAKNLLGGEFDYAETQVQPKDSDGNPNGVPYTLEGGSVSLDPQFRAGLAYNSDWFNLAADLDLMENDPVAFENPTQFASIGAELDIFSTLQLRVGYRTNLSVGNSDMASVGLGISPFGVHLDIAAMANPSNPEKEAGVALETGFYF